MYCTALYCTFALHIYRIRSDLCLAKTGLRFVVACVSCSIKIPLLTQLSAVPVLLLLILMIVPHPNKNPDEARTRVTATATAAGLSGQLRCRRGELR